MKKLLRLTKEQLADQYFMDNGSFPNASRDLIIAALYHGKRIESLTQEEIYNIEEL